MSRPTPFLRSSRLSLEPLRPFHAFEMVGVLADAELYRFTGGTAPELDQLLRRYRMLVAGSRTEHEEWHNWIVRHRVSKRAIGYVQATVEGMGSTVAWVLGTGAQGNGFATEASATMTSWLKPLPSTSISAWIHPEHVASQAVAERIELTRTGTIDDDGEELWFWKDRAVSGEVDASRPPRIRRTSDSRPSA